jgi:hypothetical protein
LLGCAQEAASKCVECYNECEIMIAMLRQRSQMCLSTQ